MAGITETSDSQVLDLLRQYDALSISEFARHMGVTATAVRQRLTRLMSRGLVERVTPKPIRGRPSHRYSLTENGRRESGHNFGDLAIALWQEVRAIKDPEVRNGLLQRVAKSVAAMYRGQIRGSTSETRMRELAALLGQRNIPLSVEGSKELPVLTAWACPYPTLAEQDRGVCAMENMMLSELIGQRVKLSECRLDGGNCCRFQTA
jgi:DeoR family transcriptional regulator, suf operon transcriptional repressor